MKVSGADAIVLTVLLLAVACGRVLGSIPPEEIVGLNISGISNDSESDVGSVLLDPVPSSTVAAPINDPMLDDINGITAAIPIVIPIINVPGIIIGTLNNVSGLNLTNIPLGVPLTNLTGANFTNIPILAPITNLTSPLLAPLTNLSAAVNLSVPIVGPILNNISTGLNLSQIPALSPLTNLSNGMIGSGVLNLSAGANGTVFPVLGSIANLTGPLMGPLTNLTGLNLTNIIGVLNNLTSPLQARSDLTFYTNVTVTISLNIPPLNYLPSIFSSFPNTITVMPLGTTKVSFYIYAFQNDLTPVPVTFTIPVISYLNVPVSGSAAVSLDIPPGSIISIVGLTTPKTHLFFGLAWQTFPQLTNVTISKLLPGTHDLLPLANITVPSLICKPYCYFLFNYSH